MMSKIPICIPTWNRPDYLRQVIQGIKNNRNLERFVIVTSEEPNEDVHKIFDEVNFMEIERHINRDRIGCNLNVMNVIRYGLMRNDRFIVLEDDIVPGRDCLDYFVWALDYFYKKDFAMTISGYKKDARQVDPSMNDKCHIVHSFTPWGWASWDYMFWRYFEDQKENVLKWRPPWDNCFEDFRRKHNLREISPMVSRVQNIGEVGWSTPSVEYHMKHRHVRWWIDSEPVQPIDKFILL